VLLSGYVGGGGSSRARWPYHGTVEAWVHVQVSSCRICGGQSGTGTGSSPSSSVSLSVSFHQGYISYSTLGMKNSTGGGCSSETLSHPTDKNNNMGLNLYFYLRDNYVTNIMQLCYLLNGNGPHC